MCPFILYHSALVIVVQAVLSRLLLAFQRLAPEPGYVQGMATLAAVVLLTFHGGGQSESLKEKDDDESNESTVLGKKKISQKTAPDRRPMPTPQVNLRVAIPPVSVRFSFLFWFFDLIVRPVLYALSLQNPIDSTSLFKFYSSP